MELGVYALLCQPHSLRNGRKTLGLTCFDNSGIRGPVAVSLPVSRTRFRYGFTIFCGAFLVFQVQLILGKYILPWFGGTPAVWTTCMLFFQLLLLGGYLYAHLLSTKLSARTQAIVHIVVLSFSVSLIALGALFWKTPLLPGPSWRPTSSDFPVSHILRLLSGRPWDCLSYA